MNARGYIHKHNTSHVHLKFDMTKIHRYISNKSNGCKTRKPITMTHLPTDGCRRYGDIAQFISQVPYFLNNRSG